MYWATFRCSCSWEPFTMHTVVSKLNRSNHHNCLAFIIIEWWNSQEIVMHITLQQVCLLVAKNSCSYIPPVNFPSFETLNLSRAGLNQFEIEFWCILLKAKIKAVLTHEQIPKNNFWRLSTENNTHFLKRKKPPAKYNTFQFACSLLHQLQSHTTGTDNSSNRKSFITVQIVLPQAKC